MMRDPGPVEPVQIIQAEETRAISRRSATKETTVQQTLYLPPAVHDQLRELAFVERVKMHALVMEGLDAVFRARGMKSVSNLNNKS